MGNRDFEYYGNEYSYNVRYFSENAAETIAVKYEELGEVTHFFLPKEHFNHVVLFHPGGNKQYALYMGRRHNPDLVDVKSFKVYVKNTGGTITKPVKSSKTTARHRPVK